MVKKQYWLIGPVLLTVTLFIAVAQAAPEAKNSTKVVFIGDSLTAGYGVNKKQAYPHVLQDLLKKHNKPIEVFNSAVSGATTAMGLQQLKWVLKSRQPDVLFLALGANDGLRGIEPDVSHKNLEKIIDFAQQKQMKVIVAGMLLPKNYGDSYRKRFEKTYSKIKDKKGVTFVPFLLKGVASQAEYNLPDGKHPNAKGHKKMAQNLLSHFLKVL